MNKKREVGIVVFGVMFSRALHTLQLGFFALFAEKID